MIDVLNKVLEQFKSENEYVSNQLKNNTGPFKVMTIEYDDNHDENVPMSYLDCTDEDVFNIFGNIDNATISFQVFDRYNKLIIDLE